MILFSSAESTGTCGFLFDMVPDDAKWKHETFDGFNEAADSATSRACESRTRDEEGRPDKTFARLSEFGLVVEMEGR